MNNPTDTYIGDGLYANYDGYQFCLRTNRYDPITNAGKWDEVFLDPNTLEEFLRFVKLKTRDVGSKI